MPAQTIYFSMETLQKLKQEENMSKLINVLLGEYYAKRKLTSSEEIAKAVEDTEESLYLLKKQQIETERIEKLKQVQEEEDAKKNKRKLGIALKDRLGYAYYAEGMNTGKWTSYESFFDAHDESDKLKT